MSKQLPEIHAVWVGRKIRVVEKACLELFVRRGHKVTLHCYEHVDGVPNGINCANGEDIVPAAEIFCHRATNSLGMFADIFRYELLAQRPGSIYVDCDVFCLKPLEHSGYLYGLEDQKVNGAVLALPAKSEVLWELRQMRFTGHKRWEWERRWPFAPLRTHMLFQRSLNPLSDKAWALTGPLALSYMTKKHNISHFAKPASWFYPLHHKNIEKLFIAGLGIADVTIPETRCIHLYSESFRAKGLDASQAPRSSIMGEILTGED